MKTRSKIIIAVISVVVIIGLGVGGYFAFFRRSTRANAAGVGGGTGTVTTMTLVNAIDTTGSVAAIQSSALAWQTTGTVGTVNVKVGDMVKKGDILMSLDPTTASQTVVQAQIDLVAAKKALNALLSPATLDIANAKEAVTTAEATLKTAQQNLKYAENPVGQSLYDSIDSTLLALNTAKANQTLNNVSTEASEVKTTQDDMNVAYSQLQRAQVAMDDCIAISCGERTQRENSLNNAQKSYQKASDAYQAAKLQHETTAATQGSTVESAQKDYDQAVANLNAALAGPDAALVAQKQAAVDVAQADLADKQDALSKLVNQADPDEVAAAQAKVLQQQQIIDALSIKAPFDGQILALNFQPNDTANTTDTAVQMADLSEMYVDVSVDESDISKVKVGNAATVTFDSLPELELQGLVSKVAAYGETVQGLVKYTVRVTMDKVNPSVLIGMTTNVNIVTSTQEGALVVPIASVQTDTTSGEYVNRLKTDGTYEKVKVVSGSVEDNNTVIVVGDLKSGDKVQLVISTTSTTSSTTTNRTGGAGGGGPFGGG
jgi:HlyD family secretion protein